MITYDELEQIKEIKHGLIKDLIEYGKKDGKLSEIDTLAHAIKNICKIVESAEDEMGGYSMRPMPQYSMIPARGMTWDTTTGYAQDGRYSGRHRDSMGRYASHGDLRSELYSVMNMANNDMERQEIQNLINRLDQNH